nr:hypothetical protein SHINE37_90033 [Rhizobiaceae bacterium]
MERPHEMPGHENNQNKGTGLHERNDRVALFPALGTMLVSVIRSLRHRNIGHELLYPRGRLEVSDDLAHRLGFHATAQLRRHNLECRWFTLAPLFKFYDMKAEGRLHGLCGNLTGLHRYDRLSQLRRELFHCQKAKITAALLRRLIQRNAPGHLFKGLARGYIPHRRLSASPVLQQDVPDANLFDRRHGGDPFVIDLAQCVLGYSGGGSLGEIGLPKRLLPQEHHLPLERLVVLQPVLDRGVRDHLEVDQRIDDRGLACLGCCLGIRIAEERGCERYVGFQNLGISDASCYLIRPFLGEGWNSDQKERGKKDVPDFQQHHFFAPATIGSMTARNCSIGITPVYFSPLIKKVGVESTPSS